jgi:hypothetical protein
MAEAKRFVIWVDRSPKSIFGPASNPVNRNGALLRFDEEEQARLECDRLNSRSRGSHIRYSVKLAPDPKQTFRDNAGAAH